MAVVVLDMFFSLSVYSLLTLPCTMAMLSLLDLRQTPVPPGSAFANSAPRNTGPDYPSAAVCCWGCRTRLAAFGQSITFGQFRL